MWCTSLNTSKLICSITIETKFVILKLSILNSHRDSVFNPRLDELIGEKFGTGYPSVTELEQRTTVAFVNTNPVFDVPQPLPENVIAVGGLQIRDVKPLPKDLEEFIASSRKGAVLFSLGTNVRSSLMDVKKQKWIIDAFEQLPDYHFLWKFEEPTIDLKLPKNVIIRQWLPQTDILAHPKIKAFFTHSGMLSTQEAIWRGVPIVGMPFAYDQYAVILIRFRIVLLLPLKSISIAEFT